MKTLIKKFSHKEIHKSLAKFVTTPYFNLHSLVMTKTLVGTKRFFGGKSLLKK